MIISSFTFVKCYYVSRYIRTYVATFTTVHIHTCLYSITDYIFVANATAPIQVRLTGGQNESQGRIEILYAGVWGTVCNDLFTMNSANVVCRELGYSGASQVQSFGPGTGQIWLDDVRCAGSEASVEDCPHSGFGVHNCLHSKDAGVVCIG